jgi:PIN domain nuclease of toxin-antitoxin system
MRLLLDTQIAIWALVNPERIGASARGLIADERNEAFVSIVSVWEIAIKFALGKRRGAPPFSGAAALMHFRAAGYALLNIAPEHAAAIEALPPLHADPFDRLLIAQALHEPMRLITADAALAAYSDTIIKA